MDLEHLALRRVVAAIAGIDDDLAKADTDGSSIAGMMVASVWPS
jgi:hypothetical protein